jgi:hypothetical protein
LPKNSVTSPLPLSAVSLKNTLGSLRQIIDKSNFSYKNTGSLNQKHEPTLTVFNF